MKCYTCNKNENHWHWQFVAKNCGVSTFMWWIWS